MTKFEQIARLQHEINRAWCRFLGDDSQLPWEEAPEWQKESAFNGVKFVLDNPDVTPEQTHQNWFLAKAADGWVYGEVKDAEKKTHPCMVPYAALPESQKAKDDLFRMAVLLAYDVLTKEKV